MPWVPFWSFDIETPLPPEEVLGRLSAQVEPERLFRLLRGDHPFEGEVSGLGFKIQHIINYRNSILPVIEGEVARHEGGSVVRISMRMSQVPAQCPRSCGAGLIRPLAAAKPAT